jgi:preprotein translocase subunit Sec61beta
MSDNRVNLPSGSGGLVRFNEEYGSKFDLKPSHVVVFIILILGFRALMPLIF